ncbi:hypothetical protein MXB_878 [Myxobolus squamalis]|nr:hypothetical protein MXB_878 [Myxobolus squamalis]
MASLKDVRHRIKSVGNIQKLTKSMKMVSAARYNKCEREFQKIKTFGGHINEQNTEIKKRLIVGASSDRGLCGSCHQSVAKAIIESINSHPNVPTQIIAIGDKILPHLYKMHESKIILKITGLGKVPTFDESIDMVTHMVPFLAGVDQVDIFNNESNLYISMRQGGLTEIGTRMSSMDGASKNAGATAIADSK